MSERDVAQTLDPLVGSRLGKDYDVVAELGRGGMGVVYLVEHVHLRKRFAAKVLSAELAASVDARVRFQTEAYAASQLSHDNIVSITDYGISTDGRPYLVMELLRGETLEHRLSVAPLSLEERVAVLVPTCHALAEAHAEGIVHRDVKPENIFLTQRSGGRFGIKVLDFGIAKMPAANTRLTKLGQALGSPLYMAPEACRGDDIDHRADVYSVGVLMYLLWCGRVPFDDENFLKVMHMQAHDPVPPPRSIEPSISPAIEAVILRALAKDPDQRYLSSAALLADLEAALPDGADALLVATARGTSSIALPQLTTLSGSRTLPTAAPAVAADGATHEAVEAVHAVTVPPMRRRRSRVAVVVVAALVAAGIAFILMRGGGGDGGSAASTPVAAPIPPVVAPSPAAAAPSPAAAAPVPAVAAPSPAAAAPVPPVATAPEPVPEQPPAPEPVPRNESRSRSPRGRTAPPVTRTPPAPPVKPSNTDLEIRTSR